MHRLLHQIEARLTFYGRRAGIKVFTGLLAAVLVLSGLGFLTIALFVWLQHMHGTIAAASILGVVLIVLGVAALLLGTIRKRTPPPPPPPQAYSSPESASIVALVEAFMAGFRGGARRR